MTKAWYSEFSTYESAKEKEELLTYLKLWKKFFVKRLADDVECTEEKLIEKPGDKNDPFFTVHPTIAIRLCIEEKEKNNATVA